MIKLYPRYFIFVEDKDIYHKETSLIRVIEKKFGTGHRLGKINESLAEENVYEILVRNGECIELTDLSEICLFA